MSRAGGFDKRRTWALKSADAIGPAVTSVADGFFVFRNSFGANFATAPHTGEPEGYGLLPARLVDTACWEVMLMRAPSS
jgi:hypothetical protein